MGADMLSSRKENDMLGYVPRSYNGMRDALQRTPVREFLFAMFAFLVGCRFPVAIIMSIAFLQPL